jgi:hypothetical protein
MLLSVPAEKSFGGQAILTGVIIRHILEDEYTLQSVMQNEIKVRGLSTYASTPSQAQILKCTLVTVSICNSKMCL